MPPRHTSTLLLILAASPFLFPVPFSAPTLRGRTGLNRANVTTGLGPEDHNPVSAYQFRDRDGIDALQRGGQPPQFTRPAEPPFLLDPLFFFFA